MTDEVRNSFGLPEDVANSFEIPDYGNSYEPVTVTASLMTHFEPVTDNLFRFHMIEEDPENECLYDHFDRFNSTDNETETFCYYLDKEKSYDDAKEVCAYHEHHSYMILYRETHFRLAEGKTYSKTTSK